MGTDAPTKRGPGRPKGTPKTGGRVKGTPNKMTAEVKAALEAAFTQLGGVPALVTWARDNPTPFYQLWGKLLPKDVHVTGAVTLEELVAGAKVEAE